MLSEDCKDFFSSKYKYLRLVGVVQKMENKLKERRVQRINFTRESSSRFVLLGTIFNASKDFASYIGGAF